MFFYTKSKEEVLNSLSSIDGLSQNGIEQSQLKYGNNTISRPKDKPFYKRRKPSAFVA